MLFPKGFMPSLKSRLIFEIMGRPPEEVKKALNSVVVKAGSEKGVDIISEKYYDPKLIEGQDNLFTAFAEVEMEFKTIQEFFSIVMMYFPSNVDIYEPENFKLSSADLNELTNFLTSRMHHYDAVAKTVVRERDFLFQKLKEAGLVKEKPAEKTSSKKATKKKSKSKSKK